MSMVSSLRSFVPPIFWDWVRQTQKPNNPGQELIATEVPDYYANASHFALEHLTQVGRLGEMALLSATSRIHFLPDYLALFKKVYHCSVVPTLLPASSEKLTLLNQDFMTLKPMPVNCVISHSTIHCLADSRYGNRQLAANVERPYRAAAKLREIVGIGRVPCFITAAVNCDEHLEVNHSWLCHDKLVRSFMSQGFELHDYFFDYLTGGTSDPNKYSQLPYRRSRELPGQTKDLLYVSGTYFFT